VGAIVEGAIVDGFAVGLDVEGTVVEGSALGATDGA